MLPWSRLGLGLHSADNVTNADFAVDLFIYVKHWLETVAMKIQYNMFTETGLRSLYI